MNELFKNINSVSDVIDLMIKGLEREWVHVNMSTFGSTDREGVCYGCAATNALCELMGKPFDMNNIMNRKVRTAVINHGLVWDDIYFFESAIDYLRFADLRLFICQLKQIQHLFKFRIPDYSEVLFPSDLPKLGDGNYKSDLAMYKEYRDWLRERGL